MGAPLSQDLRSRSVIRLAEVKPNRLRRLKSGARERREGNLWDSIADWLPRNRNFPPPPANAGNSKRPGIPISFDRSNKISTPNTACKTAIKKMAATSAITRFARRLTDKVQ